MIQFGRRAEINIFEGIDKVCTIKDVRTSFNVEKTITKEYNNCNIEVYNLAKKTRDLLTGDNQQIMLLVGYGDNLSTLFFGALTFVNHTFEGTEVITKFESVDKMPVEKNIAIFEKENANIIEFIKKACKDNGITLLDKVLDKIKDKLSQTVLAGGFSFVGRAKDAFDELSATMGADWSLQDGVLQFLDKGGVLDETPLDIDLSTGLIGIPDPINDMATKSGKPRKKKDGSIKTPEKSGYMVKTLLNPIIKPGILMKVRSEKAQINGNVAVHSVTHIGDTHGAMWNSNSRCVLR